MLQASLDGAVLCLREGRRLNEFAEDLCRPWPRRHEAEVQLLGVVQRPQLLNVAFRALEDVSELLLDLRREAATVQELAQQVVMHLLLHQEDVAQLRMGTPRQVADTEVRGRKQSGLDAVDSHLQQPFHLADRRFAQLRDRLQLVDATERRGAQPLPLCIENHVSESFMREDFVVDIQRSLDCRRLGPVVRLFLVGRFRLLAEGVVQVLSVERGQLAVGQRTDGCFLAGPNQDKPERS